MPQYIIGIDLGTTNSTMAYINLEELKPNQSIAIEQFLIPQYSFANSIVEYNSLPSFLYFPLPEESKEKIGSLPWNSEHSQAIGVFARERGAELPSRLIASAKSWLCHSGIDRREKLLPLGSDDISVKWSPVEAMTAILSHLKNAWDYKMPHAQFSKQQILITVPASFDPSARQLVIEAAENAGYPEVILLEEPQAAFYSWLHTHAEEWRKILSVGQNILVVDIGGGTTDFSLISVSDHQGNLELQRKAVGDHLLLGGDNIDLGLAYVAKEKLEEQGHSIDDWQLQALIHACRKAKEQLFSENAPQQIDITIMGRGSRLVGGSLKATLDIEEVFRLVVEGFLPLTPPEERSQKEKSIGFQQLGLPYAQDARISCQLAQFLSRTGELRNQSMETFIVPDAVLFNGGTMKATALRQRLVQLLNQWAKKLGKKEVKVLEGSDLDHAVSRGAAYYGVARLGHAIRIRAGTSHSYFIGVEEAAPAVPGISVPLRAICVVPFGMEEGNELEIDGHQFSLVLGEKATFRFFSHANPQLSNRTVPIQGTVVKQWKQELTELPPIETQLEKGENDGKTIQVTLKSKVTELGVLEIWAIAKDQRKWKLEFSIRQ